MPAKTLHKCTLCGVKKATLDKVVFNNSLNLVADFNCKSCNSRGQVIIDGPLWKKLGFKDEIIKNAVKPIFERLDELKKRFK